MKQNEFFEILGEIDEANIEEAGNAIKQKRRPIWIKFGTMAACFLLAVGISLPVVNHFLPINDPIPQNDIIRDFVQHEGVGTTERLMFTVNEADQIFLADMDVEYSSFEKLPYDVWQAVLDEFYAFTGVSYEDFTAKIPSEWEHINFYSLSTRGYKDANLEEEYRLHDYVFEYQTKSGGKATIALCSFEAPLRDYILYCDNPSQSKINGVPLMIYGHESTFVAQFSHQNVNYDIQTNNVSLDELRELLFSIITVPQSSTTDVPADQSGMYMEAIHSEDLEDDIKEFFGGSYIDSSGNFVIVLTEDTKENRAAICKELGINERSTVFKMGTYTLAYLEEVQSKISNAMMQKELPFVVSSGIYEDINRIKVCVTTEDEAELAKLKAFDAAGGAIEIEVSSAGAIHNLLEKK